MRISSTDHFQQGAGDAGDKETAVFSNDERR
jgi:hypothetical protein